MNTSKFKCIDKPQASSKYALSALLITGSILFLNNASAEEPITMQKAVETAILTNPEVLQSYKNFEAATKEKNAAFGRYLPSVDLTVSAGAENRDDPLMKKNFSRDQSSIALKQMLFDGFATKNEVERLDRTIKSKLFELDRTSQSIALDSTRAYIDLIRYKKLTALAENNYIVHKAIFEQLALKAKAGVGKKSDVEQAQSRLSLADYNMSVEGSNLHDVEARYQRLVGDLPPQTIDQTNPLISGVPVTSTNAITYAQQHNPAILAAIQDTLSQEALVNNKTSAFVPRVDLKARTDYGHDLNGYDGLHQNNVAEVVMTWNLFNGLTDLNNRNKEVALLDASKNRRDKTCRDVRLELELAYNDISKLTDQKNYLDERVISIEKARNAYRKQFDIGQRTLVDLLNAENELFEAQRLYVNVSNDLAVAYTRTHYQMGTLLSTLGISRYASSQSPSPIEMSETAFSACPAEVPTKYIPNRKELDARAEKIVNASPKQ